MFIDGAKRKPDERIYNPRNGRNCDSVAKSLTTYPFGRHVYELFGIPLVSAFVHSRFALFLPCKMEKRFTQRVRFPLLRVIMVMQFGASFGNARIFYFLDVRVWKYTSAQ